MGFITSRPPSYGLDDHISKGVTTMERKEDWIVLLVGLGILGLFIWLVVHLLKSLRS